MKKIMAIIAVAALALGLGFGAVAVKEVADPPPGGMSVDGGTI